MAAEGAAGAGEGGPLLDHVLVDDYQDTTFGAEALFAALAPTSLVVTGDPGSHVCSFQGTTLEPLLRFEERFAGAERVELATNHRSGGEIAVEAWTAPHSSEEHAAVARPEERDRLVEILLTSDLARLSPASARGLVRAAVADGWSSSAAIGRWD